MQYDWQKTLKNNDFKSLGVTSYDFKRLVNDYTKLVGSDKNVKSEVFELKKIIRTLCKCASDLSLENEMLAKIALNDFNKLMMKPESSSNSLDFFMSKYFPSRIDPRKTSVVEYHELYTEAVKEIKSRK